MNRFSLIRRWSAVLAVAMFSLSVPCVRATTYYVAPSGSDGNAGTSWATAKATIQAAINAAAASDTVLVSNGVYQSGGSVAAGFTLTNRVLINKAITVRSVNGPAVTTIRGAGPFGNAAVRCVWMTTNAVLDGFTLTNGSTRTTGSAEDGSGGGVFSESPLLSVISNCTISGNAAYIYGGAAFQGSLFYCTVKGNSSAYVGGGSFLSQLNLCMVSGNVASNNGGGAYGGTLNGCSIWGNVASNGGGAYLCTLNGGWVSNNTATAEGGGTYDCTQRQCTISRNLAAIGGGTSKGTLNSCLLFGNAASSYGGGAYGGTLNNCTVTRNSVVGLNGGGVYVGTLNNCIVYFNTNTAGVVNNHAGGPTFNYSCTTPHPGGTGIIVSDPQFVSANDFHLTSSTPCFNAGENGSVTFPYDLTGNGRILFGTADMGAYEIAQDSSPGTRYVRSSGAAPVFPFTSWATAASNIQDAVDAALAGDLVLVSNGVYQTGGRTANGGSLTNRVVIDKAVTVRSVNGAATTAILGAKHPGATNGPAAVRCVWLGNNAVLAGFTITNGATATSGADADYDGGGVYAVSSLAVISNCVVTGNSAYDDGGGSYGGTLNNCLITGNRSAYGGGASFYLIAGSLNNCTVVGNSAFYYGGGSYGGTLLNCIVYFNEAGTHTNYYVGAFSNTCTTPLPAGSGNITNNPVFVATNNFRLSGISPCINAGNNANAPGATDLDGNARIQNGTVDMGAFERDPAPETHYVSIASSTPVYPFTSWATAATNIQHAVDAAAPGDVVLVANGTYGTGGRTAGGGSLVNRVVIDKAITVRSVNGAGWTLIEGGDSPSPHARCVWMVDGATLDGFYLQYGSTLATSGADVDGGGIYATSALAVISNCIVRANSATEDGGGVYGGTLNNCLIYQNQATYGGGVGFYQTSGALNNCTVAGNAAVTYGGGVADGGTMNNCIVYSNTAPSNPNYNGGAFAYSCTTPLPFGDGNIASDPQFTGGLYLYDLAAGSPCRDAGTNAFAPGAFDLNRSPRIMNGIVDMGAYEWKPSADIFVLVLAVGGTTTGTGDYIAGSNVVISATASNRHWSFASWNDGNTNLTRTITVPITNIIYTATFVENTSALTAYVAIANTNPVWPYDTWAKAATNINDAVGATVGGYGDLVLVSNGVYATGGQYEYRVWIDRQITVRSVNGPAVTEIRGAKDPVTTNGPASVRCVYITTNATLAGFTLSNGSAGGGGIGVNGYGGGVYASATAMISNCWFIGNSAVLGGGAFSYGSTFDNCRFISNSAAGNGGGVYGSTLNNCTVDGNRSDQYGGGISGSILSNCTVSGNSALWGGGGSYGGMLVGCTLSNNSANTAGGSYLSTLDNCTLVSNSAVNGGGAGYSTLSNSVLSGNRADDSGGGTYQGTLINCTLTGNVATNGGGAYGAALTNCTLSGNAALVGGGAMGGTLNRCTFTGNRAGYGGGASGASLANCLLDGNFATNYGGGTYEGTLNNCTVTRNVADGAGGGTFGGTLYNSIVYFNTNTAFLAHNHNGGAFTNSCTTPLPSGAVNITNNPQFVDAANGNFRLSAGSPCINAGNNGFAVGAGDRDGNARIANGTVDMGAYEAQSPVVTVSVAVVGGTGIGGGNYYAGSTAVISAVGSNAHWFFTGWNDGNTNLPRAIVVPTTNITYTATFTQSLVAITAYVAIANSTPVWPYDTWAKAATNIQDAVDVAVPGDVVLVSNGMYQTGSRVFSTNAQPNRVVIDKAITVRSVNGPAVTTIRGAWTAGVTNGVDSIRCVWMTNGASLAGFTLTNGSTRLGDSGSLGGGGVWCEGASVTISNCVLVANVAYYYGGGIYGGAVVYDSSFINNRAIYGGAAGSSNNPATLIRCTLTSNTAYDGGGLYFGTLSNCVLTANTAERDGGGACNAALSQCTLSRNSAVQYGGGVYTDYGYPVTVDNCTLSSNTAYRGGGSYYGTLNNCLLTGNLATNDGGGSYRGTLNNCTVVKNHAVGLGGGIYNNPAMINNSIIYFNTSGTSYSNLYNAFSSFITNSCAAPLLGGVGNTEANPQFVDAASGNYHLLPASPCKDSGNNGAVVGTTDLDGNPRIYNGTVDMGAFEVQFVASEVYVNRTSTNPVPPYSSWATAATNIQDGVDAAVTGATVYVSNGVYQTGGRVSGAFGYLTNRVVIGKLITVRSMNGPGTTFIVGAADPVTTSNGIAAVRCVWITNGASLVGFTLTNGYAGVSGSDDSYGGGIYAQGTLATVSNCVLTGGGAYWGGGAYQGTLNNCTLAGNRAYKGGGTYLGQLNGCTLAGNRASEGGGVYASILSNCTLTGNAASGGLGGGASSATLVGCNLNSNSASYGGGAYVSTLTGCTLSSNTAGYGGATYQSDLADCTLSSNSGFYGGGSYGGTLTNCVLTGNSSPAGEGGAAYYAVLNNCTLSGNRAQYGGGTSGGTLNNCILSGNTANLYGGGSYIASLNGCTLAGNAATNSANGLGGGSYGGTLTNCTLSANAALVGGGAYAGMLNYCVLSNNIASSAGGGSSRSTQTFCRISGNVAQNGGGASDGKLNNCTLSGNTASQYGGASYYGTLNNCLLSGNYSGFGGGGSYRGTLNNCTLSRNSTYYAGFGGAGSYDGTLNNCIIYFNTNTLGVVNNDGGGSIINYSCITPENYSGSGNITNDP